LPAGEGTEFIFGTLNFFKGRLDNADNMVKAGFVKLIVGILCQHYSRVQKKTEGGKFISILRYIDENFAEDLESAWLAGHFGYTKTYFSMLFNKFTGMNFREYINALRIEKIKKIAHKTPDVPITRIVLDCGFNSLVTYYRALNRITAEK